MTTNRSVGEISDLVRSPEVNFEDERIPMSVGLAWAAGEAVGAIVGTVEAPFRAVAAGRHMLRMKAQPDGGFQSTLDEIKTIPHCASERMSQFGRACGLVAIKAFVRN